ncbi:MAG TPA: threonine synthase [Mycobacteriales bacterium]|nr:threonine synthase [Mycobacteriales bacterium]
MPTSPPSTLAALQCSQCATQLSPDVVHHLCPDCSSPLLARYDLERAGVSMTAAALAGRPATLWRYAELLPVRDPAHRRGFGEGMTPLHALATLGTQLGVPGLLVKDDGVLPTGTFKARGAAIGVARAAELGVERMIMPTNGNAGAAWSAYAALHGLELGVVMPLDAPFITRVECIAAGASVALVDGLISDAGAIVTRAVAKTPSLFNASTLTEPYRIEGKKTIALEFAEQLGWRMPDVVVYPTGGGVGLIGIHKALGELRDIGLIQGPLPRLVAAQATGCAPVVRAYDAGEDHCEAWIGAQTAAFGINVPKPLGDRLILRAIRETDGTAIAVSDEAALDAQQQCARTQGLFVCPESGVALAAVAQLRESGWIDGRETVMVISTGNGMKYPDSVPAPELATLSPADDWSWPAG